MTWRKLGLAIAAATTVAMFPSVAWGGVEICVDDPPVTVVTPAGAHVTFNTFIFHERADKELAKGVKVSGTAVRSGSGSLVTLRVSLPPGADHHVFIVGRSMREEVVTEGNGTWGDVVILTMKIPQA